MKNKKFILGVLIPLMCCCSCGPTFSWDRYVNDFYNMSLESSKLKNYKVNMNHEKMDEHKASLLDIIKQNGSVSKFNSLINTVYIDYADTLNALTKCEIDYYANPSDELKTIYEDQYDYYVDFYQFLLDIEADISASSQEIKIAYFGEMSDEEIDKEVELSNKKSQAATYEAQMQKISDEMEEIYNNYMSTANATSYKNATFEKLLEYVQLGNQIKDIFELDSYLDYVYVDSYYRDYTVADAMKFVEYTKKYITPLYAKVKSLDKPNGLDNNFLKKFEKYNLCNREGQGYKYYKDYAEELGGSYLDRYNHLWKDGYYVFTDNTESFSTAFVATLYDVNFNVSDCAVYFSAGYQGTMNIIHEFGHYYALTTNSVNQDLSYDVKETHSQGDEYTFLNYLVNKCSDDPHAKDFEYFADYTAYDTLVYIINEACIAEIENFAFNTPDLTKDTLRTGVQRIIDTYRGGADETYWCYPTVAACGYYISYATSLIESLQFYSMDFKDAKTAYINLCENPDTTSMVDTFVSAGLSSPFEEETFKTISSFFTSMQQKYNN